MTWVLLLVAALEAWPGLVQEENPPAELRAAREEERVARLELEAGRSKEFYLLADVGASTLSLNLSGLTLASYKLESVDLGLPVAVIEPPVDELAALFTCESSVVEAPREIQPGPPPNPAEAKEPAEPEEEPRRKRLDLVCEPPLTVHLVSGGGPGIRERLRLPGDREKDLRVRMVVAVDDAARLLSSIPERTLLLFSLAPSKANEGGATSAPR